MIAGARGGVRHLLTLMLLIPAGTVFAETTPLGGFGVSDQGKAVGIEADQGIEWQQSNHVYIARGHVKATRGGSTLYADTLSAWYRPVAPKPGVAPAAAPQGKPGDTGNLLGDGATEIYRIEADGAVRLTTDTQTISGDHAVYDIDKAMMVMTGKAPKLVTPKDTVTARDSLEWYDKNQLAVARGDALAVRDGKMVHGDVLTAEVEKPANQPARINRINALGHVVVTSQDQIARGNEGVYNLHSGIATLAGNVSLTKGDNELRGQYAVVDLNHNVGNILSAPPNSKLTGGPPARVEGLLVPRSKSAEHAAPSSAPQQ